VSADGSIVVSGLGCVLAGGCGREHLTAMLERGIAPSQPMETLAGAHRPAGARTAVTVRQTDLTPWLEPLAARRMARSSRMAVAAMHMALEEAGLTGEEDGARVGVAMATAYGPAEVSERILVQILDEGPQAVSPFLFTESVANAPAAQMAIHARATAANLTVTQRESGPLLALGLAMREIERGRSDRMLVGAVDEMNPLLHAVLNRFGALTGPDEDGVERARPFDRDRRGYLAGEGAAVLVLELEDAARRRGARPLARVGGVTSAFDPTATPCDCGTGAVALGEAARRGLERSGCGPAALDAIVSCACGGRRLDRLEGESLRRIWNDAPLPPVLTPKSVTGEVGAALLATPVLVLVGTRPGPCADFRTVDPQVDVAPHDGGDLGDVKRVLVSALGTGGAAAWAWLEAAS
jgi:3-oxoacyl-[acyl-carrier-protein] synthase II